MKLLIIHNHFRPGGVRRVIETGTVHLVRALRPRVREVILVGGEPPDETWWRHFAETVGALNVIVRGRAYPWVAYQSELRVSAKRLGLELRSVVAKLLDGATRDNCVVWAHNQGLARNLALSCELGRACAARKVPLMFHHHDWWFDNRWQRWPEMRRNGFRNVSAVARAVFPLEGNVRHIAINRPDAAILSKHFGKQAGWLPNPAGLQIHVSRTRVRAAGQWLAGELGASVPVWLMPCRLLRRKNIAEALLLTRWLRPEAWLVTTGDVSSADEEDYAAALTHAAEKHQWQLRLGILAGPEARQPSVGALMGASEVVLLTSLLEGFGLPYLEATAAKRPLIARALPNVLPDLARLGFRFPQTYDEILVEPSLFDYASELKRQERLYARWLAGLPRQCRSMAGKTWLLTAERGPVPFSRLTLAAQFQVLAVPPDRSWDACACLNPFLRIWRELARTQSLRTGRWPREASRLLGGPGYARRWCEILRAGAAGARQAGSAFAVQNEFMREKLASTNLYPLTWR